MHISDDGIRFIKQNEGFSSSVYDDNGRMAIGYGHDLQVGETFPDAITPEEGETLLRNDLATRFEPSINILIPASANCTQSQYDALCDFAYNLGVGSLATMLRHGWSDVPNQIPRWNHVNGQPNAGLTARRAAEVEMWNA